MSDLTEYRQFMEKANRQKVYGLYRPRLSRRLAISNRVWGAAEKHLESTLVPTEESITAAIRSDFRAFEFGFLEVLFFELVIRVLVGIILHRILNKHDASSAS